MPKVAAEPVELPRHQHISPSATLPTLEPVIGGRLREQRIIDGWPDILRLIGSIRARRFGKPGIQVIGPGYGT